MTEQKMTREERVKLMEEINTKENIIKKFQEKPEVVDDHCTWEVRREKITGLVEFMDPEKDLAPCFNSAYYSLNRCYINPKDDELHVSQMSIAGVLWGPYPDAEQLKKYNDGCVFESGKIKCIHLVDGTKVYPKGSEPVEDKPATENNCNCAVGRHSRDKFLLTVHLQDGTILNLSVVTYDIDKGVLSYEKMVPNAKESADTAFYYVPLCNITNIKSESYNMLDRVSKYN